MSAGVMPETIPDYDAEEQNANRRALRKRLVERRLALLPDDAGQVEPCGDSINHAGNSTLQAMLRTSSSPSLPVSSNAACSVQRA